MVHSNTGTGVNISINYLRYSSICNINKALLKHRLLLTFPDPKLANEQAWQIFDSHHWNARKSAQWPSRSLGNSFSALGADHGWICHFCMFIFRTHFKALSALLHDLTSDYDATFLWLSCKPVCLLHVGLGASSILTSSVKGMIHVNKSKHEPINHLENFFNIKIVRLSRMPTYFMMK